MSLPFEVPTEITDGTISPDYLALAEEALNKRRLLEAGSQLLALSQKHDIPLTSSTGLQQLEPLVANETLSADDLTTSPDDSEPSGPNEEAQPLTQEQTALVTQFYDLAVFLARKFYDKGQEADDLNQVAWLGLVKAAQRFKPEKGFSFSTFATATIIGEVKRHFRDYGWKVHVSRKAQEAYMAVSEAETYLTTELGRHPTVQELASELGLGEDTVRDAQQVQVNARFVDSLDATQVPGREGETLGEKIEGDAFQDFEHIDTTEEVKVLIRTLDPLRQQIIYLRFWRDLNQTQIADKLGISQMQVSRLLAKTIKLLSNQKAA